MTDEQANKLRMGTTTLDYLQRPENVPIWTPVAIFGVAVSTLEGHTQSMAALAELQRSAREGKALNKENLNQAMITAALVLCGPVASYAHQAGDIPLRERHGIAAWELEKIKDGERGAAITALHDEAATLLAAQAADPPPPGAPRLADHGVTSAMLAATHAAVTAYEAVKDAPRGAQVTISQATDALAAEEDKFDDHLKWVLDRLMQQFLITHPDFHNGYESARVIVDLGS